MMRLMTVEVMRATARAGSADSAAAMVTISAPIIENMTVVTAARTARYPRGEKPSWMYRLKTVGPMPEVRPKAYEAARSMKTMMALTLMEENQNSNSPKERADSRFTAVISTISAPPI